MALKTLGIEFDELSSDPGSPVEGQVWYNSTDDALKGYFNSATRTLITDLHSSATNNPHTVTLEQARTAGSTLAGDVNMNSAGRITNLLDPSADQDAATKAWTNNQIQGYLQGLDWQESVLDRWDPTGGLPGGPSTGDRYIATATANGWTDTYIYEYNGASWDETIPNEGCCCRVEDENTVYIFDGAAWGTWDATVDHGALQGLGDDDHTQYLLASGSRALSGNLDMGTNAITNVGNVDGVDVSGHASRHAPGGGDAVSTAAPSVGIGAGNQEGSAATLSRSDHNHTIRESGGQDLTLGAISDGQYLTRSGTTIAGAAAPGAAYLVHKAGRVLAASFAGTPKTATVTFSGAFADANYAVALTVMGTKSYAPYVDTQAAGSFVINLDSNVTTGITHVAWVAVKDGESS